MANEPGTALEKPSQKELDLARAAIMDGKEIPTGGDPEVISRAIMERILNAESFEEAFQSQTLPAWRDTLVDKPVYVRDVRFNPSTKRDKDKQGPSIYAVVDVQPFDPETGEMQDVRTVSCGGRNVLIQLYKMLEKGWADRPVMLISKDTSEGYEALYLESVEAPF
jgi:hypothetical protein